VSAGAARVLILTPMKDATGHLDDYFALLGRLTYPRRRISLGFLESDSADRTYETLAGRLPALRRRYRRARLWKRDFGFRIPGQYTRWNPAFQVPRRTVLAKSRNHLLFHALDDEDWVLWLDVDVVDYPPDILQRLIAIDRDVVQPHCVTEMGRTFDHNAWRDEGRLLMNDLRAEGDLVRLHAVGATMLLVRADLHRDGLVFPPYLYGRASPFVRRPNPWLPDTVGELETEGLGLMAMDMGHQCWGMPNLEVRHRNA
jgi:Anp1